MEVGGWCNSGHHVRNVCWGQTDYDAIVSLSVVSAAGAGSNSKAPIWRLLWRKIKRQKQRIVSLSVSAGAGTGSNSARFSYDPYDYAQNFDQGLMWNNSDDLSRSFSARFAVPSSTSRVLFHNNELGLMI